MKIKTSFFHSLNTSCGPDAVWGSLDTSVSLTVTWESMCLKSHVQNSQMSGDRELPLPARSASLQGNPRSAVVSIGGESQHRNCGWSEDDFGVPRPTNLVCLCRQKWTSYSCSVWHIHLLCCQPSLQLSPVEKQCRGRGGKCHRPHPALSWRYNWHLQMEMFNITA